MKRGTIYMSLWEIIAFWPVPPLPRNLFDATIKFLLPDKKMSLLLTENFPFLI